MTFPIHDAGGLTEAEIKLAIEESAERREAGLDRKLEAHRAEISDLLERTEDTVRDSLVRLADLQATVAVVSTENVRQTAILESIQTQGQQWHVDDLAFRADVLGRVGKIEVQQVDIVEQVRRLRWIGLAMYGTSKAFHFCLDKLVEAEFWKLAALALMLYFLKLFSPMLYHLAIGVLAK